LSGCTFSPNIKDKSPNKLPKANSDDFYTKNIEWANEVERKRTEQREALYLSIEVRNAFGMDIVPK
jgi:hypothetical protein